MMDKNTAKGEKCGKEQRIERDGQIRLKKTDVVK